MTSCSFTRGHSFWSQHGRDQWGTRVAGYDAWTVACINTPTAANCPSPAGPDYDLGGSGGNLTGNLIGSGQKSGIYTALNASTDGPSIVDRVLYWGSGFPNGGSTNNKVYTFSLP